MAEPLNDISRKVRGRRARATVARRLAAYYTVMISGLEADAESFFDRVMQIDAERRSDLAAQGQRHSPPLAPR